MKKSYSKLFKTNNKSDKLKVDLSLNLLKKRITQLMQPLDTTQPPVFENLFNISDIHQFLEEFSTVTGVSSIIIHPDGTPITKPVNFCWMCNEIIYKMEKVCVNCYLSIETEDQFKPVWPIIQPCLRSEIWNARAKIIVDGKHIADWKIGQIRDGRQTEEKGRKYARKIQADEDDMIEAFCKEPFMKHDQFNRITRFMYSLAKQMSITAGQNIQQVHVTSPPDIIVSTKTKIQL